MSGLTGKRTAIGLITFGVLILAAAILSCARPTTGDADRLIDQGFAYMQRGDLEKALTDINEALRLEPKSARALSYRSEVYLRQGDRDRALRESSAALALDPKLADAWVAQGLAHLEHRAYEIAVSDFSNALDRSAKNVRALSGRGKAYLETGEWDRAIADFTAAIAIAPDVDHYVQRSTAHFYKHDMAAAGLDHKRALEHQPTTVEGFTLRGRLHVLLGEFDRAIADLTAALALDPNHFPARIERAYAYWGKGEEEKALADAALVSGPGIRLELKAAANRITSRIIQKQPFKR